MKWEIVSIRRLDDGSLEVELVQRAVVVLPPAEWAVQRGKRVQRRPVEEIMQNIRQRLKGAKPSGQPK